MEDILKLTAVELGQKIKEHKISVVEAAEASLWKMEQTEPKLNAFITVDPENVRKQAEVIQKKIWNGELTDCLAGVPVAIKDNLCTSGIETTCASKMLSDFCPSYTAKAVENLKKAGAVILGKTNMDEFAMGSTSETSYYGAVKNPWNEDYVPGGSSGGSAAAVASSEAFYALGTDTGGSIRQPSSYCGVCGMKPTYGTVSRYGMIAYASSLDQIGPIAKNVTDCAYILERIASYDSKDSTSIHRKELSFRKSLGQDIKGMKIGIPRNYLDKGISEEVKEAVLEVGRLLEEEGAYIDWIELKLADYAVLSYYIIACSEASSNLARFDGVKYGYRAEKYDGLHGMYNKSRSEGFGWEVKKRIMLGSFVLSSGFYDAYYLKALKTRALVKQEFDHIFSSFDLILSPTAPTTAPKQTTSLSDPIAMYMSDIYTVSVNLAGLPAISQPCKVASNGLPIGIQLIGDCMEEEKIFRAAYVLEQKLAKV